MPRQEQHSPLQGSCCPFWALQLLYTCISIPSVHIIIHWWPTCACTPTYVTSHCVMHCYTYICDVTLCYALLHLYMWRHTVLCIVTPIYVHEHKYIKHTQCHALHCVCVGVNTLEEITNNTCWHSYYNYINATCNNRVLIPSWFHIHVLIPCSRLDSIYRILRLKGTMPLRLLYFTQIFIYFSKPLRLLYSLIIYEIVNFSFFTLYSLLLLSFFLYLKSVPIYVIVHVLCSQMAGASWLIDCDTSMVCFYWVWVNSCCSF